METEFKIFDAESVIKEGLNVMKQVCSFALTDDTGFLSEIEEGVWKEMMNYEESKD